MPKEAFSHQCIIHILHEQCTWTLRPCQHHFCWCTIVCRKPVPVGFLLRTYSFLFFGFLEKKTFKNQAPYTWTKKFSGRKIQEYGDKTKTRRTRECVISFRRLQLLTQVELAWSIRIWLKRTIFCSLEPLLSKACGQIKWDWRTNMRGLIKETNTTEERKSCKHDYVWEDRHSDTTLSWIPVRTTINNAALV